MSERQYRLLVVDDEYSMREVLEIVLANAGYLVSCAGTLEEAKKILEQGIVDVVLTDLYMGKDRLAGLQLLYYLNTQQPTTPAIMITGHGSIESAVEAMRLGALDYIQKPFKSNEEILLRVAKAVEKRILLLENEAYRFEQASKAPIENIVGESPAFKQVLDMVRRVAVLPSTVAIYGESGVGKELIARTLHALSHRAKKPFVAINCGGIPETLLESELFGYKKGAFTGALQDKNGLFVAANGGTLFLDEIGDMPLALQVKLLRVLDDGYVTPVGGLTSTKVDVRVLSATNKNLAQMVEEGQFRKDLYYRLNVIPIVIPPLRERKEDIPLLAKHFIARHAHTMVLRQKSLSPEALQALMRYDWPGNVREMSNVLERALGLSESQEIGIQDLPIAIQEYGTKPDAHDKKESKHQGSERQPRMEIPADFSDFQLDNTGIDLERVVAEFEIACIRQALELGHYSQQKAARLLGLTPRTLRYRLEKYNLSDE